MKSFKTFLTPCLLFLALSVPTRAQPAAPTQVDVVLIGAGIMSATLGTLLKELDPTLRLHTFEKLDRIGAESSDTWNNAGTGHSALCELNYTPMNRDGSIDIAKALHTMEAFEISKQFWAYFVKEGHFGNPRDFIHPVPHMSLVMGREDVSFLRQRFEALKSLALFRGLEFAEDETTLRKWIPVAMKDRDPAQPIAATRSELGTDVDFGSLTRTMFNHLAQQGSPVALSHEVQSLSQNTDQTWQIEVRDLRSGKTKTLTSKFVFIGAGGGTLPLLQKAGIPEARGYGGFPVSGQFLVSKNQTLADLQDAKVYGKAAVGSPPMSVPHLDTRVINGKKVLIFGPFAGPTTKFLKYGSSLDLFRSVKTHNLGAMLKSAYQNVGLLKYLAAQMGQSHEDRMQTLREFVPNAKSDEWELVSAGQRVQIIKDDPTQDDNVLRFGTEVVEAKDGTLAALLGASPGASTSVSVMLDILNRSFAAQMQSFEWQVKLRKMIPSYGRELSKDAELTREVRNSTQQILNLRSDAQSDTQTDCNRLLAS